ncbi:MAG: aconitate hydratase 1 [Gammaproteobacteria bacterium TMED78]|nr:MAG: aconitate hydratase 1 [Gammaproteobacteria bacterium TMED78]|tara:strand:- start:53835 stop:56465 length:2631 start_codon:yes stop_codon:yes gene_type:complete
MKNSFNALKNLTVNNDKYKFYDLNSIDNDNISRLPYTLKILLENLLRFEDGENISSDDILSLASWDPKAQPNKEIAFTPARVILQDFTGVPAVVDLAAMRDAMVKLGGKASSINPLSPAELVIDHSVQVDSYGSKNSLAENNKIEFLRNKERYSFLKWGQSAFKNFKVVPPNTGIVHQVNLEYLSRVVFSVKTKEGVLAYPDTLVGTDSHTTMVNGLGVLGWGVGGIEAEAAMLGQPVTMLIPQVIGFNLKGELSEGATATDLVLTITEMLRSYGVVGKFVEFFGSGLSSLPLADRATLGNMSPEFGSTCAVFPIDNETLNYLKLSGRDQTNIDLVEYYAKEQGIWGNENISYTDTLELDLDSVVPSIAGPKRPQDRISLKNTSTEIKKYLLDSPNNKSKSLNHGDVLIAAITSCTNTSNPAVMIAAGLLAKKALEKGLKTKDWVKTSLAPGSKVVKDYLESANLLSNLNNLGFNIVGYGCTTCIGNSGPLREDISEEVKANDITGCSVVSGNRNFEGRIHPLVKMNFLASPPLVVAYALAGNMKIDLYKEPIGYDKNKNAVFLKDIWPTSKEINDSIKNNLNASMFSKSYSEVFKGEDNWNNLETSTGENYSWDSESTYVKNPPYFENISMCIEPKEDIRKARALLLLGDSITTDHISPAGSIASDSPAAKYLKLNGIKENDFNSYGSRRGNHEVMMRGTFANIRLKNKLAPGTEGSWTKYFPSNEKMNIFDAAKLYKKDNIPLVVIAGKEYGSGSSRDWAAKGTMLLGIKAVIVESFERIHRSNLIGMGVLPLQFLEGESAETLNISGNEYFDILEIDQGRSKIAKIVMTNDKGSKIKFDAKIRIDTPKEQEYYINGGILHYVLRQLANKDKDS